MLVAVQIAAEQIMRGAVSVVEARRVLLPRGADGAPPQVTEVAWSTVTGQLAATATASNLLYLVDPSGGGVLAFDQGGRPAANAPLAWSRQRPLLVVNREMTTRVYETVPGRPQAPSLVREISTRLPDVLRASSLSLVPAAGGEWVVLAGETTRRLAARNREVAAFSLPEGESRLDWRLPVQGGPYRLTSAAAAASGDGLVLAAWVQYPGPGAAQTVDRMWVIDLQHDRRRCELDVFTGKPAAVAPELRGPTLSDDGRLLVFAAGWGDDSHMFVYDAATCALLHKERVGPAPAYGKYAFSPDGRWLAAAMPMYRGQYGQGRLSLWSTRDWKLVHDASAPGHFAPVFNKQGNQLAVGLAGGLVIYDIKSH